MTSQRDKDLDIHGPGVPVGAQELILGGSKRAQDQLRGWTADACAIDEFPMAIALGFYVDPLSGDRVPLPQRRRATSIWNDLVGRNQPAKVR